MKLHPELLEAFRQGRQDAAVGGTSGAYAPQLLIGGKVWPNPLLSCWRAGVAYAKHVPDDGYETFYRKAYQLGVAGGACPFRREQDFGEWMSFHLGDWMRLNGLAYRSMMDFADLVGFEGEVW